MKLALCVWNGRLAPVFDCAGTLLIIEGELRSEHRISSLNLVQRARFLGEQGVRTLVCGALSHEAQLILTHEGIELVPFRSGDIEEVLDALYHNRLQNPEWAMPGCACRRRQRKGQGARCGRGHQGHGPSIRDDPSPPRST